MPRDGDPPPAQVGVHAAEVADLVEALPQGDARLLVAIAGPPGSGKSTLAEALTGLLVHRGHAAVLMPMDGFHMDDRLLDPKGLLPRKGAPETFDFAGFAAALVRVRDEPTVLLPVFDRSREIAIAGAKEITPDTRIVVVEGNYLCLHEDPWASLRDLWDFAVFLEVPEEELERRLLARWLEQGLPPDEAHAKALGNDIPNARRTAAAVCDVDLVLRVSCSHKERPRCSSR